MAEKGKEKESDPFLYESEDEEDDIEENKSESGSSSTSSHGVRHEVSSPVSFSSHKWPQSYRYILYVYIYIFLSLFFTQAFIHLIDLPCSHS